MKRFYTLFIILALSTNFWHTAAMSNGLKWLTLRDGLAGISVTCFAEDPSGKMWIGTTNGVTLYNGLSMKTYSIPRIDGGQPNFCFELKLDDEGNVWAATRGGVYVLKRWKNDFERIAPEITGAEAIVCVDKSIYVGCREGLFHIDTKSRKTHAIDVSSGHQRGNNSVRCIRRWGDELWISMRTGLVRMNLSTQKTSFVPFETPSGLSRFDICQGKLYIGSNDDGLLCYNKQSGTISRIPNCPQLEYATINDMTHDNKGRLWVASSEGLKALNERR